MPTARRRYQVTETDDVAHAIDVAAQRWPDEPRSRLIVRAITAGGQALAADADRKARRITLRRLRGSYADVYGPGYLEALRTDWPA
jgi:hypothetical protein